MPYKCNFQHCYITLILKHEFYNIIFKIKWKLCVPSRSAPVPYAVLLKQSQTGDMHASSVAEPVSINQDLLLRTLCQIAQCSCQKQIQNVGMFILRSQVTFDDVLFLQTILFVKRQAINILCHWRNVVYFKKCVEYAHTNYSHFSFIATVLFCFD